MRTGSPIAREKYEQIFDGEWVCVPTRGHLDQCCGCGLVHETDYRRLGGGSLELRRTVKVRATAAVRREKRKREKQKP